MGGTVTPAGGLGHGAGDGRRGGDLHIGAAGCG
jgi:hypothetical protein